MTFIPVNLIAVFVSGVAFMVLGMVWYSPTLFANTWMKLVNLKKSDIKQSEMGPIYGASFVCSMVLAYVLGYLIRYMHLQTPIEAVTLTIILWIGFVAMPQAINYLYVKKPLLLFAIDSGYHLTYMIAMAIIMSLWG